MAPRGIVWTLRDAGRAKVKIHMPLDGPTESTERLYALTATWVAARVYRRSADSRIQSRA